MRPAERIPLLKKIANALDSRQPHEIDFILEEFGFTSGWGGFDHENLPSTSYDYALGHIKGGTDYDLIELAAYLDSTEDELAASGADLPGPWKPDHLRLFVSHTHRHARLAGGLRHVMSPWLIDAFVAHDDIEPTSDWRKTIKSALRTCHVAIAIVTSDFPESKWCDQEVGFCLARSILIVPLMFGAAPYGFLAKFQAITVKREYAVPALAAELLELLATHPETQTRAMPCVVRRFAKSNSFDAAREGFGLLKQMPRGVWDALIVCDVEDAVEQNQQIRNARLTTGEALPDAVRKLLDQIGVEGHLPLLADVRRAATARIAAEVEAMPKIIAKAVRIDTGRSACHLRILVNRPPSNQEFRYEERNGLYYGERDGWVNYFAQTDDKTGLAGDCFDVTMQDGTTRRIEGPWSSNPDALRRVGFPQVVDVVVYTDPSDRVGSTTAVTAAKAHELEALTATNWG